MYNQDYRRPLREPSPYPRYVINALIPDPLAEPLDMMRKRLDRWSTQWLPPHITIIPPFNADLTDGQRHQIVSHPFPFELSLTSVGRFRHSRTGVVWYGVEAPDLKIRIEELFQTMPWLKPFADQRPGQTHITVASRVPHHEMNYVETAAAAAHLTGNAAVERLSLFRWDEAAHRWERGV